MLNMKTSNDIIYRPVNIEWIDSNLHCSDPVSVRCACIHHVMQDACMLGCVEDSDVSYGYQPLVQALRSACADRLKDYARYLERMNHETH